MEEDLIPSTKGPHREPKKDRKKMPKKDDTNSNNSRGLAGPGGVCPVAIKIIVWNFWSYVNPQQFVHF
jgi:hypothetical protein